MKRKTPAARALVGCLALRDGATTNQAFKLAGYKLTPTYPVEYAKPWYERTQAAYVRTVSRNGRTVKTVGSAYNASDWLTRLGRKLSVLLAPKPTDSIGQIFLNAAAELDAAERTLRGEP